MRQRLTKAVVDAAKPGKERVFIWDSGDGSVKGFGLKVMPSGHKCFVYQYRMAGGRRAVTQRYTIGPYSVGGRGLTMDAARKNAEQLERDVSSGTDPIARGHVDAERKRAEKIALENAQKGRVELVLAEHLNVLKKRPKKLRSFNEREQMLNRELIGTLDNPGPWRGKLVTEITASNVRNILKRAAARGSVGSTRNILAAIRPFFAYVISEEYRTDNPASDIDLKALGYEENARKRYLTPKELKDVWLAASRMPYPFGPVYQLLILTAQRLNEVAGMRKSEFTLDNITPWKIPGERAKNGEEHIVHLSRQALDIIKRLPKSNANIDLIFTTTGKTPVSGFSKAKSVLDKKSGITRKNGHPEWRTHDFRRTFATNAAEILKIPPHITDKILNHKSGSIKGVAAVYQRAAFLEERASALDAWGNYVESLIAESPSNVVPITTARR